LLRDYEILYIVRPDIEEADLPDVTKRIETLIESLEGSIQNTNVWGKRRLAYEVDHLKEGHYVLTDFQIEPVRVPEMEATLKISETVFRHLIVRKPVLKAAASIEASPPEAVPDAEPEAVPDVVPEAVPGGEPEAVPGAEPEAVPGAEPEAVPDAEPAAVPEVEQEAEPTQPAAEATASAEPEAEEE
jgi:small subunit ribosomal protein S6